MVHVKSCAKCCMTCLRYRFRPPKPSLLIQRILQIATDKDSIVPDSFAGSGTTATPCSNKTPRTAASATSSSVEMDENIAQNVTAERVRRGR